MSGEYGRVRGQAEFTLPEFGRCIHTSVMKCQSWLGLLACEVQHVLPAHVCHMHSAVGRLEDICGPDGVQLLLHDVSPRKVVNIRVIGSHSLQFAVCLRVLQASRGRRHSMLITAFVPYMYDLRWAQLSSHTFIPYLGAVLFIWPVTEDRRKDKRDMPETSHCAVW